MASQHMARALDLATSALFLTSPNPRVGCVLVNPAGQVIGEGHTQMAGFAHAEVMALKDALANGADPKSATAYVTLEPCNHQGRTGPCSQALVSAGIQRVVASTLDPNPLVAGQGFETLRRAGIEVEIGDGQHAAHEINIGYFKRMSAPSGQGAPWVRMKAAASLDGITALSNGVSQWITSEAARIDGHHWRARSCAILTGIGTVLADDPRLDVRHVATQRQPAIVLIDSNLDAPLGAKLFQKVHGICGNSVSSSSSLVTQPSLASSCASSRSILIYTATPLNSEAAKWQALQALGAEVIFLPHSSGKVDLAAVMRDLGKRQINELHVEAGFKLNGSLWREGLVDELLLYQSPQLLGVGQGIANIGAFTDLTQSPKLKLHTIDRIGDDLRVLARKI